MKCPLLSIASLTPSDGQVDPPHDCLHQGCTWWDESLGYCCMFGIHRGIYALTRDLANIKGILHDIHQLGGGEK